MITIHESILVRLQIFRSKKLVKVMTYEVHTISFQTFFQRDPGLASEGVLRLCTLLSLAPPSPDLNPLDFFVWSHVENITNITTYNTKASLIAAIRRVFAELPPALVKKACSQFRIRIEAVIEAEGGYIQ